MDRRTINAPDAPAPPSRYAQAVEVTNARRILYVSGQIPETKDGTLPSTFGDQCRQAWANVEAQLRAADMSLDNVVKVTTFLARRSDAMENRAIRQEVLGERTPALTAIVTGIFDERWLVEIEAIAAA